MNSTKGKNMLDFEFAVRYAINREAVFKAYETYPSKLKEEKKIELMSEQTGMNDVMIKNILEVRRYARECKTRLAY